MQVKSAAYLAALTAASANWRYGVDVLAGDENTPLEDTSVYDTYAADRLLEQSSQVILDVTAKSHRTFTLQLRNQDARYLPGASGYPSGGAGSPTANGLVWYNVRYRPWIDLATGYANGQLTYDRTYLGIYVLVTPQVQVKTVGSITQLSLIDKSALLCKPFLIAPSAVPTFTKNGHTVGGYAAGATFTAVLASLATRGGIPAGRQLITASTLTLPADYAITEGTEWWQHIQTLANSMAYVAYFDGTGNFVARPNPVLQNQASVWTFADGPLSTIAELDRTTDLVNTYNHVVALGGSSSTPTYRGEAQVTDASSPYHANQIGDRIVYVGKNGALNDMTPDPNIGSTAQAQARAQAVLAQHLGQQESVDIKGRNVPILEPYDRVTIAVNSAGLNLDFLVQQLTWNLHNGGMELVSMRWLNVTGIG